MVTINVAPFHIKFFQSHLNLTIGMQVSANFILVKPLIAKFSWLILTLELWLTLAHVVTMIDYILLAKFDL